MKEWPTPRIRSTVSVAGRISSFSSHPVISMERGVTHGGSRTNLIGNEPDQKLIDFYCNDKRVSAQTPPTFLFHTSADTAVLPENSIRFYQALLKNKVPAELHIYEKGPHGVGLAPKDPVRFLNGPIALPPGWSSADSFARTDQRFMAVAFVVE